MIGPTHRYKRRWFTLTISKTKTEPPTLSYCKQLVADGDGDDSASAAASASNGGGGSGGGGGGARKLKAKMLTRSCCIQLNQTDMEQFSVTMGAQKADLVQARQLQYLEFAVVRHRNGRGGAGGGGGGGGGGDELLRARAESHSLLSRWVQCLCHAILLCRE